MRLAEDCGRGVYKGWEGKVQVIIQGPGQQFKQEGEEGGRGQYKGGVKTRRVEDVGKEPDQGKVREHLIYNRYCYCYYAQIATSKAQIDKVWVQLQPIST